MRITDRFAEEYGCRLGFAAALGWSPAGFLARNMSLRLTASC